MIYSINPKISTEKCNGKCEQVDKENLLNEDDRNLNNIVCRRCGSIVFPEDSVEYIEDHSAQLRIMTHQGAGNPGFENISWWWYTEDDMDFDTIGWQTIEKKKVLMCGDCELGPLGYRSEDNKKFWVAVERVSYKSADADDEKEKEEKRLKEVQESQEKEKKRLRQKMVEKMKKQNSK